MHLTIVRHGQSQTNVEHRLWWSIDTPLTQKWKDDALLVAKALENEPFDIVVSSTLQRTIDTAKSILQYHTWCELKSFSWLNEIDYGAMNGRIKQEVIEELHIPEWGDLFETMFARGIAENPELFYLRVVQVLEELVEHYPDKHVCIVAHGWSTRELIRYITGVQPQTYPQNCSITRCTYTGWKWSVDEYNKLDHLLSN
jgi:probable phosphoglycerate mutase